MSQYIISTVIFILSISVPLISTPVFAQFLAPVENIADFFVTFLSGPFARSIAIIGLAVCGFLAMTGKLPWRAALAGIDGIILVFCAAVLPQIPTPLFLRRRV